MTPAIIIRNETDADFTTITDVTVEAFKTLEISNHTEQFIIEALRAAKALTLSLVAEVDGRVVGHIAFSPVTMSDGTQSWYGLGPVSVLPEYQRKDIGRTLIREGLSRLKDLSAQGCCLVGHPEYYRRFGFENVPGLVYEGVPQEAFLGLSFDGRFPQGTVTFHEGFEADGQLDGANDAEIRFDHLAVNVEDIEMAVEWFGKALGFSRLLPPGIMESSMGDMQGKRCRISNAHADVIELIQTDKPISRHQEGAISHFCLRVSDLERMRDRLLGLGYLSSEESTIMDRGVVRILFFTGIDGVRIELIEKSQKGEA
jgi:putative acetyltransferase